MRTETKEALKAARRRDDATSLADRIARNATNAADREAARANALYEAHAIEQPSLPSNTTTDLVTMTVDELHDVIYQAVSTSMQRAKVPARKAQASAARAAITGQQIVRAHGWTHRGEDPRG